MDASATSAASPPQSQGGREKYDWENALNMLEGKWTDNEGSMYYVRRNKHESCSVYTERDDGEILFSYELIHVRKMYGVDRVAFGEKFCLDQGNEPEKRIVWNATFGKRRYCWERMEDEKGAALTEKVPNCPCQYKPSKRAASRGPPKGSDARGSASSGYAREEVQEVVSCGRRDQKGVAEERQPVEEPPLVPKVMSAKPATPTLPCPVDGATASKPVPYGMNTKASRFLLGYSFAPKPPPPPLREIEVTLLLSSAGLIWTTKAKREAKVTVKVKPPPPPVCKSLATYELPGKSGSVTLMYLYPHFAICVCYHAQWGRESDTLMYAKLWAQLRSGPECDG